MDESRGTRSGSTLIAFFALAALVAVGGAVTATPSAAAQEPQLGLPDAPRNLKVLPADTTTRALVGMMRGFAGGLGVRCTHCHVGDNPGDLSTVDFASDAKPTKQKARVMIRMVQAINDTYLAQLTELGTDPAARLRVGCATCHHGQARPRTLQQVLAEAIDKGGPEMASAEYDRLRDRYYGSWTYDFGERALLGLADQLARDGNSDAAFAMIDKNQEMFPESAFTYISRGQLHAQLGDMEQARAAFEACLQAIPGARFCQQALDRLAQQ